MTFFKKNNWQVVFFYICLLLFYPLVWVRLLSGHLTYWSELHLFTVDSIALLCCVLLFAKPKALLSFFSYRAARLAAIAFGVILLVAFVQIITCYDGRITYLWSSVYWIAIPLFCAVNWRDIEKYLPSFMIFLALASIVQLLQSSNFDGLPGNWNWSASLIAISFPFISFAVYPYLRTHKKVFFLLNVIIAFAIIALIFQSRATVLSLLLASCFVVILRYWRKLVWLNWLRLGVFAAIVGLILFSLFSEDILNILKEDQRFYLWQAVLPLIKEHLYFGCGPKLFESVYAPYIPADYYLGQLVAVRHTHSHNHLLQFAAMMGIPALIAWLSLIFYALIKNLRQAIGEGNWSLKLYLFVFVLLFVHSMFDIVVLSWPLGCILLIVLGILLGRAVEDSKRKELKKARLIAVLGWIAAFCCGLALVFYSWATWQSSLHYRNAKLFLDKKDPQKAFSELKKSLVTEATPANTYLAAKISLFNFKNPQACLKYLDLLNSLGFENYQHNNQLRARALYASNKSSESLVYFAQEQENFPLSCVNLYYYRFVLNKLGRREQANAIEKHLKSLLKLKGFDEKMLPLLLKNPRMDLRFRYYNDRNK